MNGRITRPLHNLQQPTFNKKFSWKASSRFPLFNCTWLTWTCPHRWWRHRHTLASERFWVSACVAFTQVCILSVGVIFKQPCFSYPPPTTPLLLTPSKGQGLNHHKWRRRVCVWACMSVRSCWDNMTCFSRRSSQRQTFQFWDVQCQAPFDLHHVTSERNGEKNVLKKIE